MRRLRLTKIIASSLIAVSILALNPIGASAKWKQDSTGWWYTEGNLWVTGWKLIDGKWYYFYNSGYMAHDTVIDKYYLGSDGTQIEFKKISIVPPSNWTKVYLDGIEGYSLDYKGTNVGYCANSMMGYSEEDYMKASISKLKSELGIDNIEVSEEMFNNKKGRVIHYSTKVNNKNTSIYQVFFTYNNTAYVFTLWGYEKNSEENMTAFKNMLNTVKFEN